MLKMADTEGTEYSDAAVDSWPHVSSGPARDMQTPEGGARAVHDERKGEPCW